MFIVGWDGVDCVDWEVWFLPLDPWDCLPADPHITALYVHFVYTNVWYYYISLQCYCTNFLFVLKKVEFNMEKEGREALKIGLKKKYQKDGKGKRAYLFLWPIILLLQL